MGTIKDLAETLRKYENREKIALPLLDYLYDEMMPNELVPALVSPRNEIAKSEQIKLTAAEKGAYKLVIKKSVVTFDDLTKLTGKFASFRYRNHTNTIMNSLVEKGLIGKIKLRKETVYATPKEAVMWALKELDGIIIRYNPKKVGKLTGLPSVEVLEVLDELVWVGK